MRKTTKADKGQETTTNKNKRQPRGKYHPILLRLQPEVYHAVVTRARCDGVSIARLVNDLLAEAV